MSGLYAETGRPPRGRVEGATELATNEREVGCTDCNWNLDGPPP